VVGSYDSEVSGVEGGDGGDGGDFVSFGDHDEAGIDETEAEIGVLIDEFDASLVVGLGEVNDVQPATCGQSKESALGFWAEPGFDQPSCFGDDGGGCCQAPSMKL